MVPCALAEHCDESFTNFLTAANQTKAGNKKRKTKTKLKIKTQETESAAAAEGKGAEADTTEKLFKLTKKTESTHTRTYTVSEATHSARRERDTFTLVLAFGLSILEESRKLLVACLQNKLQLAKRVAKWRKKNERTREKEQQKNRNEITKNADCDETKTKTDDYVAWFRAVVGRGVLREAGGSLLQLRYYGVGGAGRQVARPH